MGDTCDQFVCGECQEKFQSITEFLLHKVQHVDMGKPGGCLLCGMSFSRQASLREHLNRKHNIPQLRCNPGTGKRRGRPRKERSGQEINPEQISKPENEMKAAGSSDSPDAHSYVGEQTMHVMIDKMGATTLSATDLSEAVLQAGCSVVFPSNAAAAAAMVETCEESDFRQLLEQVNSVNVSHPQTFQHQPHSLQCQSDSTQNQPQSLQNQPVTLQNSSQALQNHLHVMQSHQNSLQTLADTEQKICMGEGTSLPTSTDPALNLGNKSSVSLKQQMQNLPSSNGEPVSGEGPEPDFLFVLLTNHIKRKSMSYSKQSFKCFHCNFKTFWRRALVKHMRENHADNLAIHQCIAVNKSEKLRDQQVMKMSEYAAVLARQRKQVNGHRIRGVERQDLPGYHPCSKCGKVFGRLRYLRKHQAIHKAEKRFLCDDCGKAFKTKAYLAAHRQTHQAKVYKCAQCDFTSSINSLIHAHRQLHNDNSVICEVCGSAYNDRATLKKHKQVHDKARPYPCDYPGCTWRFKTEVMCRAHYRGHTTSGRFICHVCSYVFRHKHHLQRHLGKVHGMDEATIYHATCSSRNHHSKTAAVEACEDKELVQVVQDDHLSDTVNLIVNSGLSSEQLQSVLESGQFVIATDEHDSSVNYEVANITMNVSYDTLTETPATGSEGQTIFIPNDAECSQIIFQHEPDAVPSSVET